MFHPVPAAGVGAAGQRARLSCRRARGSIRRPPHPGWKFGEETRVRDSAIPVPGISQRRGSARRGVGREVQGAPRDSCRDTNRLQKRGVIWRGSSGRMLMESSARPQSRHSMVYSCGGTGERDGGGCHSRALPQPHSGHSQRNQSRSRHLILDCNQTWGGSRFVPQDEPHRLPRAHFPAFSCCIGNVPGQERCQSRSAPHHAATFRCSGPRTSLTFPRRGCPGGER